MRRCSTKTWIAAVLVLLGLACGHVPLGAPEARADRWLIRPEGQLRIATFNIYNRPWARSKRLGSLSRVIEQIQPDILALQEVATGLFLPGNPAELLGQNFGLGYRLHWHETNLGIFKTGLALLSRYPIVESEYHEFTKHQTFDPKGFAYFLVQAPGGPLRIVNTHMASTDDDGIRESELEELAAFIQSRWKDGPVLLVGDLNTPLGHPVLRSFERRIEQASGRVDSLYGHLSPNTIRATWHSSYKQGCSEPGGEPIDHVLIVSPASDSTYRYRASEPGGIFAPVLDPQPSDHCPVIAEIERGPRLK